MSLRHGRMISRAARLKRLSRRSPAVKLLIQLSADTSQFKKALLTLHEAYARLGLSLAPPPSMRLT